MPRRKKLPKVPENPDFTGLGKNNKKPQEWLVQKTTPLTTLSQTSMTLPEFKILDAYLSRIDSHNPDKRYVRFEKGELEQLLGVEKINKTDLSQRLRNLFQTLEIRDPRKPKGFTLIALFTKAECEQDEDGLWQVNLACSYEAMEYMFNPENIGYLRYRLKNVINLTSRYSYILFLYLLDNRWRKSWEIDILELKFILNCTAESYSEFKLFNDRILKKCCKEINEKTDCHFTYETIKRGRKVAKIKFIYQPEEQIDGQLSLDNVIASNSEPIDSKFSEESEEKEIDYGSELANLLGNVACRGEFSLDQVRILQDLVLEAVGSSDRLKLCDYLSQLVHRMNYYHHSKKPIKDRFAYLTGMIENDIKKE